MKKYLWLSAFVILAACTKSKEKDTLVPDTNEPTITSYTVTDTLGAKHTFSDTSYLEDGKYNNVGSLHDDDRYPGGVIWVWKPAPGFTDTLQFVFSDYKSADTTTDHTVVVNSVAFFIPEYQINAFPVSPKGTFELVFNYQAYMMEMDDSSPTKIIQADISTTISDHTDHFISGTFTVHATTVHSKTIQVNGTFKHVPTLPLDQ